MSGTPEQDAVKATREDSVIGAPAHGTDRRAGHQPRQAPPLKTVKCTIQFGGLIAVNALDMSVERGQIYGLIGPNGAGKTTVFNLLTGVYKPTSGEIYFQGNRIDGLRSYAISRRGVSRTFQNIRLFPSMSVLENVMTACHRHAQQGLIDAVFRLPRFERDERDHREFALELLEIFDLARVKDEGGTSLPYGSQRRFGSALGPAPPPPLLFVHRPRAAVKPFAPQD